MNVISFATYNGSWSISPESKAVLSILKGFKKHLHAGNSRRLQTCKLKCSPDTQDVQAALDWFGSLGCLVLESKNLPPPIVLVPIPNSNCVCGSAIVPRTFLMASAIRDKWGISIKISDVLRWRKEQMPSHQGGCRDAVRLFKNLSVLGKVTLGTVVLVDDVTTTGAHIIAAAAKLASLNIPCSEALCFAKTQTSTQPAFSVSRQTLGENFAGASLAFATARSANHPLQISVLRPFVP